MKTLTVKLKAWGKMYFSSRGLSCVCIFDAPEGDWPFVDEQMYMEGYI